MNLIASSFDISDWDDESWENDFPRKNKQVVAALKKSREGKKFRWVNNDVYIFSHRLYSESELDAADQLPSIRFDTHGIQCGIYPDGVLLQVRVLIDAPNSDLLLSELKNIKPLKDLLLELLGKEIDNNTDFNTIFLWVVMVSFEDLTETINKISLKIDECNQSRV